MKNAVALKEPMLHVRLGPTSLDVPAYRGSPIQSIAHGPYTIKFYWRAPEYAPRCFVTKLVYAVAFLGRKEVGFLEARYANLNRHSDPLDFAYEMDSTGQMAYEVAETVRRLGRGFWNNRAGFMFLDTCKVLPAHRLKGLATIMARGCVSLALQRTSPLDIFCQPYPLDISCVSAAEAGDHPIVTPADRDAEFAGITSCWVKILPCLERSVKGGNSGDRVYRYGRLL